VRSDSSFISEIPNFLIPPSGSVSEEKMLKVFFILAWSQKQFNLMTSGMKAENCFPSDHMDGIPDQ
jgi:hypothetical protein